MEPVEKYTRSEKSLSTLTRKFVELLKEKPEVDLNVACSYLEVTKKRRIYDITNVLEGVNLIKKSNKNSYSWMGKLDNDDEDAKYLKDLVHEKSRLDNEEKELDNTIKSLKTMNTSLDINKTFLYLTKNDFIKAYGQERTVLVTKDYKKFKFNFNTVNDSLLLNNQKNARVRNVEILGDVIRPTQVKLVNLQSKPDSDSSLLFCLDEMDVDDEETEEIKSEEPKTSKPCAIGKLLNINLFRRRLRAKKFLELEQSEREKLAMVLDHDRFKDKSLFHYISEKNLVTQSDYEEPDFILLSPPSDSDYEQSYSLDSPSVHDLFDIEIEDTDYLIVEEFLDEEEV